MKKFTKVHFTIMRILMLICGILSAISTCVFVAEAFGLGLLFYHHYSKFLVLPLVLALFELPFTILLFIASTKFKKAKLANDEDVYAKRGSLLGWGICCAIITIPIFAIGLNVVLPLVIVNHIFLKKLEEKANQPEPVVQSTVEVSAKEAKVDERSFGEKVKQGATNVVGGTKDVFGIKTPEEKLKEQLLVLKSLKDEGLITEEEYQAKKRKILGI